MKNNIILFLYIPVFIITAVLVLYVGLVGYRIMTANGGQAQDGGTENGLLQNLGESVGIGRKLKGERTGKVNFLLVGVPGGDHDGPDLTDTVMLVSVNTEQKKINMFSIPRDLYVEVPGFGYSKMNAAYSMGKNYEMAGGGIQVLKDLVEKITGQKIDYYIKVDFDGFVKAIDAIGGVDVVVTEDLYDYLYPDGYEGYEIFSISAGPQHLDGTNALKYARSRETTSDFDRARRQQQLIMAAKDKIIQQGVVEGVKIAVKLVDILSENLETDLKIWEWERIVKLARDWKDEFILDTFVFNNSSEGFLMDGTMDGLYILQPRDSDYSDIHDFIAETISGKGETQKYKFDVYNATSKVGLGGRVADELKVDGHEVGQIGNAETNLEKSVAKCIGNTQYKTVKEYLETKWGIKVEKLAESSTGVNCIIDIGEDFQLDKKGVEANG